MTEAQNDPLTMLRELSNGLTQRKLAIRARNGWCLSDVRGVGKLTASVLAQLENSSLSRGWNEFMQKESVEALERSLESLHTAVKQYVISGNQFARTKDKTIQDRREITAALMFLTREILRQINASLKVIETCSGGLIDEPEADLVTLIGMLRGVDLEPQAQVAIVRRIRTMALERQDWAEGLRPKAKRAYDVTCDGNNRQLRNSWYDYYSALDDVIKSCQEVLYPIGMFIGTVRIDLKQQSEGDGRSIAFQRQITTALAIDLGKVIAAAKDMAKKLDAIPKLPAPIE